MKINQKGVAPIVIAIMVALLLGVGGYAAVKQRESKKLAVKQQNNKSSETINWKSYGDRPTEYPADWTVEEKLSYNADGSDVAYRALSLVPPVAKAPLPQDVIFIGGYRISVCGDVPQAVKCAGGGKGSSFTVTFTNSTNPYVLDMFDKIIARWGKPANTASASDWKTYTNEKYGFELKYPGGYILAENKTGISIESSQTCKTIRQTASGQWPKDCFSYNLLIQKNKISGKIVKTETKVAGYSSEKLEIKEGLWDSFNQVYFQFEKGGDWYISSLSYNSENKTIAENLLNRILSTFKFTSPAAAATDWKTYKDEKLEFEYPSSISIKKSQETGTIGLSHSIVYKHPDPCDFVGGKPSREKLFDFNVTIEIFNKNLKDTLDTVGESQSMNKVAIGSLNGFTPPVGGIEGCGRDAYYFPISSAKTLVIYRSWITEFTNPIGDSKTYLNLPGIIPPNQEQELFTKIITSLKVNP